MRARITTAGLLIGAAWFASCADEASTGLEFVLQHNANITDSADLIDKLHTLEMIVDSPEGLFAELSEGTEGAVEGAAGEVTLRDVDDDSRLELQARIDVSGLDHLPKILLEQRGLPPDDLELRLEGLRSDGLRFAYGELVGGIVSFEAGVVREEIVPFNTRASQMPPYVTQTAPSKGSKVEADTITEVWVFFSKRMDAESLKAPGVFRLLKKNGANEWDVVPASSISVQWVDNPPYENTSATYHMTTLLPVGFYRIEISTAATDSTGAQLDQVPSKASPDPFSALFEVGCSTPPCSNIDPPPCGSKPPCPPGMACVEGVCQPVCPEACGSGSVCHTKHQLCVSDCRLFGGSAGCPDETATCGEEGTCWTP